MIRKSLFILWLTIVWLTLCASSFGANEIQYMQASLTGQTLYAKLRAGVAHASVGQYWNGTAWTTLTTTAATFDIAMTEVTTTGFFQGTLPAAATGKVVIEIWQDANDDATPDHATDILLAEVYGFWDGALLGDDIVAIDTVASNVQSGNLPANVYAISDDTDAADNLEDAFDESGASAVAMALESLNVTNSTGTAVIFASTGGNGHGFRTSGNGAGEGHSSEGGTSGHGSQYIGGSVAGDGINTLAFVGDGWHATSDSGDGFDIRGGGTGNGAMFTGGATGVGGYFAGGGTSGDGILATATSGDGLDVAGGGLTGSGLKVARGGASGDDITIVNDDAIIDADVTQISGDTDSANNLELATDGGSYNLGGGGITSQTTAFTAAALDALVLTDTGEATATAGSVAKLAQGASDPEVLLDYALGTHPDGSIGDRLLTLPNATAGASGGLLIAGSNAATTFATLTSTGAFTTNGVPVLDRLYTALELDGAVYRLTTNALEQAPSGAQTNPQVLISTTVGSVTSQTQFVLPAGAPTHDNAFNDQAIVFYDASNSDFPSVRTVNDYVGLTRTVIIDSAPDFTVIAGDGVKVFTGGSGGGAASGGPIEQRVVASSRRLQARARGDGTFGVVGRIRMLPGETTLWSVDFRGTQVAPNNNLFGMSAPTFTGAQAANMSLADYGVDDTEAKFEITLDAAATTSDVINVRVVVQPTSTETIIVVVPVTVGS